MRIITLLFALSLALLTSCGHSETSEMEAAYTMTSDEIVNAFLEDGDAAFKKYTDQIVQISGPIMELQKENGKVIGIKLSSDEFNIVNGSLQETIDPSALDGSMGDVTIKGVCSGFLGDEDSMLPGGTVELKRVAVVPSN